MSCKCVVILVTAVLYRSHSWKKIIVHLHFTPDLEYYLFLSTVPLTINATSDVEMKQKNTLLFL